MKKWVVELVVIFAFWTSPLHAQENPFGFSLNTSTLSGLAPTLTWYGGGDRLAVSVSRSLQQINQRFLLNARGALVEVRADPAVAERNAENAAILLGGVLEDPTREITLQDAPLPIDVSFKTGGWSIETDLYLFPEHTFFGPFFVFGGVVIGAVQAEAKVTRQEAYDIHYHRYTWDDVKNVRAHADYGPALWRFGFGVGRISSKDMRSFICFRIAGTLLGKPRVEITGGGQNSPLDAVAIEKARSDILDRMSEVKIIPSIDVEFRTFGFNLF